MTYGKILDPVRLSKLMTDQLKLDADFFGLQALREQLELDGEFVIDCEGTRIITTRRVLSKGKDYPGSFEEVLAGMIDPESKHYRTLETDGSLKILFPSPDQLMKMINFLLKDKEEDFFP